MNFWKSFKPKSCSVRLQALSKEEALSEVVDNLITGEALPARLKTQALEALLAREKLGSTGVGMGVAIPHVKLDARSKPVSIATLRRSNRSRPLGPPAVWPSSTA